MECLLICTVSLILFLVFLIEILFGWFRTFSETYRVSLPLYNSMSVQFGLSNWSKKLFEHRIVLIRNKQTWSFQTFYEGGLYIASSTKRSCFESRHTHQTRISRIQVPNDITTAEFCKNLVSAFSDLLVPWMWRTGIRTQPLISVALVFFLGTDCKVTLRFLPQTKPECCHIPLLNAVD